MAAVCALLGRIPTPEEYFRMVEERIAGLVRDGQHEGAFRKDLNARVVARSLFGALDAILLTWALGEPDPASLRKAAGQCANLFLGGLQARAMLVSYRNLKPHDLRRAADLDIRVCAGNRLPELASELRRWLP